MSEENTMDSGNLDWSSIRILVMDVDGILTDGTVFIPANGDEYKQFSIVDGLGLVSLKKVGVQTALISGRLSGATSARAAELKLDHIVQGKTDKLTELKQLAERLGFEAREICYMGDDEIDIPAIQWAGIGVSVPNGRPSVKALADWVTPLDGGRGAVREVCDRILASRNETVLSLSQKK